MKAYPAGPGEWMLILERGEDVLASVTAFAETENVRAASLQGIGAVRPARVGEYDYEKKTYLEYEFDEPLEVVSLLGNISLRDGRPFPHLHMMVGRQSDASVFGGHLLEGTICALTLEIEVRVLDAEMKRTPDPRFNLAVLYDPKG